MKTGSRDSLHIDVVTNSPRFAVLMGCVCMCERKTKHDLTVRDRLTCISNALSLVVEVTVREE